MPELAGLGHQLAAVDGDVVARAPVAADRFDATGDEG
jgi:hypothetical protein